RLDDDLRRLAPAQPDVPLPAVAGASATRVRAALSQGGGQLLDLRASSDYRNAHVAGARRVTRPRIGRLKLDPARPVYLIGPHAAAALVAGDLQGLGHGNVYVVEGGQAALAAAGATIEASPDDPPAEEAIDFLSFVHDRHDGNL